MLHLPNFERLKIFHVVYEKRSILAAADALFVTRSAVSQSLKLLEQEVKISLFIRDSKRFQPTPAADQLYLVIDPFVNEMRMAVKNIETGQKKPVGRLKVGAPLEFGATKLTEVMARFREKYPDVSFELFLGSPLDQLKLLCDGKLDLAFVDNGNLYAEKFRVTLQTVFTEEFVMILNPKTENPGTIKRRISSENFGAISIVDYLPHAPVAAMWFDHHFGKRPRTFNVVYSAQSVRAVLTAVREGIGIGVVPSHFLHGEFNNLEIVSTVKNHYLNRLTVARQIGKTRSFTENEFIDFFKKRSMG